MPAPLPPDHLRLGVLDQSPVPSGSTGADALRETVALAIAAEALGYARYWLAEHHNATGLAGTAPEVLVARVASSTSAIRVGAGGVMLSHYSPLKVAEVFRVLHALFPGRIDLGVGRTAGADAAATVALQPGPEAFGDEHFPRRVAELVAYLEGGGPGADHPHAGARAMPEAPDGPDVWLLGSSPYSAGLAAGMGLAFCFAHFITPAYGARVVERYRRRFTPSGTRTARAAVAVSVVCADTDSEAERLATSQAVWRLRPDEDRGPLPSPEEAASVMSALDGVTRARLVQDRGRVVVGGPGRVRAELVALARAFGADEVLVVTVCHDPAARLRSYELLSAAFGLRPASPGDAS